MRIVLTLLKRLLGTLFAKPGASNPLQAYQQTASDRKKEQEKRRKAVQKSILRHQKRNRDAATGGNGSATPPAPGALATGGRRASHAAVVPDTAGFGKNIGWIAVPAADKEVVLGTLRLGGAQDVGWDEGIAWAYQETLDGGGDSIRLAVLPAIRGWVLIAGVDLFLEVCVPSVTAAKLSGTHGRALFFWNVETSGCAGWSFYRDGEMTRAVERFAAAFMAKGPRIPEEEELFAAVPDDAGMLVDMFTVGDLAGLTSVSPFDIGEYVPVAQLRLTIGILERG